MAAQKIPDRIILVENKELAASYANKAHALLENCRKEASRQNLGFFCMASRLADGTIIVAKKVGDFSIAEIASPFPPKPEPKKKIEPTYPTIIIYVGNEEIGYTVGKFLLNGEIFIKKKVDTAEEMYALFPYADQESVYKRRPSVTQLNEERISINSEFAYKYDFCEIEKPGGFSYCKTLPLSETVACFDTEEANFQFHEKLHQHAETMNHLRTWCSYRDNDWKGTHFAKLFNWTQVSECVQGTFSGQGARVCMRADGTVKDEDTISTNSIYTAAMLVDDWWRCSTGWTDNTYWALNVPVAFGQATFLISKTPVGLMVADDEYTRAPEYIASFLDGSAMMREDTEEPYLELWDNDTLYSFLDEENLPSIYAFSNPPMSYVYAVSPVITPVSFIDRGDGLPALNVNSGSHNIMTSIKADGLQIDAYLCSFIEAEYVRTETGYQPVDIFHRMFGRFSIGVTEESKEARDKNGEKLFTSIQKFLRDIREEHVEAGYIPENVRSLRGNIGLYLSDDFKKPGPEADAKIRIFNLVNDIRKEHGLEKLSPDGDLDYAAEIHAWDCAKNNIEGHESSYDGRVVDGRVEQTLYGTRAYQKLEIGENVSWGYPSAEAAVVGWMNSPGHRANILKEDWRDTGIAVKFSEEGQPYYIQVFGIQDR